MKNNYIKYKKYYIKENLESFLYYYKHFSLGVSLPKSINIVLLKYLSNYILKIFIIIVYLFKIYKFKYKKISLNDNAYIIYKGKGKNCSIVKLYEQNGQLKIIKEIRNKKMYFKEKNFYNIYKNNKSNIKLPKYEFINNNTIEIEFLNYKCFQRLINDGSLNLKTTLKHYDKIKNELKIFYGNKTLIHGDFWPTNIFINKDVYYLIDFTYSENNNRKYDLYVLLFSIFASFNFININNKTIINKLFTISKIMKLIGTNTKHLILFENKFKNYRKIRFSDIY